MGGGILGILYVDFSSRTTNSDNMESHYTTDFECLYIGDYMSYLQDMNG